MDGREHEHALAQADLIGLAAAMHDGERGKEALDTLVRCLRDPAALAGSFKQGGTGSPDFTGLAGLSASITGHSERGQVMEALSLALRSSQPCKLEQAQTLTTLTVEEGEELTIGSMGVGGGSAVRCAWYGPVGEERSDTGSFVTDLVVAMLGQGSSFMVCDETFGSIRFAAPEDVQGQKKVLLVDMAVPSASSAVVVKEAKSAGPPASWLALALAAALPMLEGSLPKDDNGVSVLPHPHDMMQCEAEPGSAAHRGGRIVWRTNKICDRCMDPIWDRTYFHCAQQCDVDFCYRCHDELVGVLQKHFSQGVPCPGEAREHRTRAMSWTVHLVDEVALQIMNRSAEERLQLAQLFATEWSAELLQALVGVVVDVCNAKLLYNCNSGALATRVERTDARGGGPEFSMEVTPLYLDESYHFWYNVALLQFLYECSGLLSSQEVLDGHEARGHRIPIERFILEGINKCSPNVEWNQWEKSSRSASTQDVLRTPVFQCSSSFRLLVAHNNLLPISFRRQCLVIDILTQMNLVQSVPSGERVEFLELEVEREPEALVETLCRAFSPAQLGGDEGKLARHLFRPLAIAFKGEAYDRSGQAARGPGVRREFFRVALHAFVSTIFVPTGSRTYWFSEVRRPDAYFACGVLLAQVLLHAELIPNVFPWTLYDLLLRDIGSPRASKKLKLRHLAAVSAEEANSIGKVHEYAGEDITELFGDLGWERVPGLKDKVLTQSTKTEFVDAYIDWSFGEKIEDRFRPFRDGFLKLLGSSFMVRRMVDAKQLERIVCGGEAPVDAKAIRRFCVSQDWEAEGDQDYLDAFWSVLEDLPEAERLRFVAFVTGSDRMPLQGWEELRVKIQKNGSGDDRLPTAYTCFSLLLLPRYSSTTVLRTRLLSAVRDAQGFGLH